MAVPMTAPMKAEQDVRSRKGDGETVDQAGENIHGIDSFIG